MAYPLYYVYSRILSFLIQLPESCRPSWAYFSARRTFDPCNNSILRSDMEIYDPYPCYIDAPVMHTQTQTQRNAIYIHMIYIYV